VLLTSVVTGKFLIHCQYSFQIVQIYETQHRIFLHKIAFKIWHRRSCWIVGYAGKIMYECDILAAVTLLWTICCLLNFRKFLSKCVWLKNKVLSKLLIAVTVLFLFWAMWWISRQYGSFVLLSVLTQSTPEHSANFDKTWYWEFPVKFSSEFYFGPCLLNIWNKRKR
jgi:hypothetical protein